MMPFMGIQVLAMFLLYMWPSTGLWLPHLLYKQVATRRLYKFVTTALRQARDKLACGLAGVRKMDLQT